MVQVHSSSRMQLSHVSGSHALARWDLGYFGKYTIFLVEGFGFDDR